MIILITTDGNGNGPVWVGGVRLGIVGRREFRRFGEIGDDFCLLCGARKRGVEIRLRASWR